MDGYDTGHCALQLKAIENRAVVRVGKVLKGGGGGVSYQHSTVNG